MLYKVTHNTTYLYSDVVPVCHNEVHLTPRESGFQRCKQHRLLIRPEPAWIEKRTDYFGNALQHFSIHEGHHRLSVTAVSRVQVRAAPKRDLAASPAWEQVRDAVRADRSAEGLDVYQFTFDSPFVRRSPTFVGYGQSTFLPGRPLLEALRELTARIYKDFRYDTTATTVNTPLEEVFHERRGVCQDFAHVALACVRSVGLAARYVSGYLLNTPPPGKTKLVGADASHAWLSVYCPGEGWVDFDPTNDVMPSLEHITLSWGRDYHDVCPIKGVFVGGGHHAMTVSVDVRPMSPK
ncbi:MAG: transglutaminase family protein [Pirellulales bacterium]